MNSSLIILALERPHLVSCSISQCSPKRQNPSACVYVCGGGGFVSKSCLTLGTPWTVARRLLCLWDFPGRNTGVGYHFLLQGIFLTQGWNPCLLNCKQVFYINIIYISSVSSVTHLCPTLCDPINCSTPGLPIYHQLLEFTQTHVH